MIMDFWLFLAICFCERCFSELLSMNSILYVRRISGGEITKVELLDQKECAVLILVNLAKLSCDLALVLMHAPINTVRECLC